MRSRSAGCASLGHHGALEGEQDRAQPFELDIVFAYEMNAAARSDDLLDAVDYGGVTSRAARVVSQQRFASARGARGRGWTRRCSRTIASPRWRSGCTSSARPLPEDVTSIGVVRRLSRTRSVVDDGTTRSPSARCARTRIESRRSLVVACRCRGRASRAGPGSTRVIGLRDCPCRRAGRAGGISELRGGARDEAQRRRPASDRP